MELYGIRQFSRIEGANRNPGATEDNDVPVWNNGLNYFEFKPYWGGAFNSKTSDGILPKGDDSAAANYIWKLDSNKNPSWRKEEYLATVAKAVTGNSAKFTMNSGDIKTLSLGALAWLDSVETTLILPGDKKILFDDNDVLSGDASFTFDKTNKYVDLTAFTALRALNGVDVSAKGFLQYLGGKNMLLGHGTTRTITWAAGMTGNTLVGENSGGSLVTGSWNYFAGPYAGANVASNVSRSIQIGPYSGRLNADSDKLYVGNVDYASDALARLGSLLHGDFSTGWLRVNNRLDVGEEVKIGTFDVGNTPEAGMVQFVDAGGALLSHNILILQYGRILPMA